MSRSQRERRTRGVADGRRKSPSLPRSRGQRRKCPTRTVLAGGSNCFLPIYDCLRKDSIMLSTFHGKRVYHAISLYGLSLCQDRGIFPGQPPSINGSRCGGIRVSATTQAWNLAWIHDHVRGQIVRHHSSGGLTLRGDHDRLCSNICIDLEAWSGSERAGYGRPLTSFRGSGVPQRGGSMPKRWTSPSARRQEAGP